MGLLVGGAIVCCEFCVFRCGVFELRCVCVLVTWCGMLGLSAYGWYVVYATFLAAISVVPGLSFLVV